MRWLDKKHIIGLIVGVVLYEFYHRGKGATGSGGMG